MLNWLKLSQRDHSGHLKPHEHTSYIPLCLLLFIVGIMLTAYTAYAESPGPMAGSIGLTGTMPGKAPTVAATITSPTDQQHFNISPVGVSGTCPKTTLVEIFKNDIFAGSTPCTDAGIFSLDVDFLVGQNILVAKVYDALNQPGPDSNKVIVYYDVLPGQAGPITSLDFGSSQLILSTDTVFRGIFPGQEMNIPISIISGTPPFAINIQWGDSTTKLISRNDNISFIANHTYSKAGNYQISIQATDSMGRIAFLTVAAIVNGQPSAVATTNNTSTTVTNKLLLLWPLYTAAAAVVTSFFLGERREKRILRARGLLLPS